MGSRDDCMVGAFGWLCCSRGSGDHAGVSPSPPPRPWPGPVASASFCLSAPPPHGGVRDLSSRLVLSPPDQGGDSCNYRLWALVSVTLWAMLPFWHCLVSDKPILSYMTSPDLVQCVPSPLATNSEGCRYGDVATSETNSVHLCTRRSVPLVVPLLVHK